MGGRGKREIPEKTRKKKHHRPARIPLAKIRGPGRGLSPVRLVNPPPKLDAMIAASRQMRRVSTLRLPRGFLQAHSRNTRAVCSTRAMSLNWAIGRGENCSRPHSQSEQRGQDLCARVSSFGRAVSPLASHCGEPRSISGRVTGSSHVGNVLDDAFRSAGFFSVTSRFPHPFHFGAAPYSPQITLVGSRDLAAKKVRVFHRYSRIGVFLFYPPPFNPLLRLSPRHHAVGWGCIDQLITSGAG
ncbi:hypothetical protein PR048_032272 [Dryococelus australis]|uniref:Uncharacterized protein n=1 Tax=Dryococelus australis TaxID=614101 RepID=A0ABQ9G5V3_9NEOP|nr:hypothetical protein PR048_032272 [Dryococelus australis]